MIASINPLRNKLEVNGKIEKIMTFKYLRVWITGDGRFNKLIKHPVSPDI